MVTDDKLATHLTSVHNTSTAVAFPLETLRIYHSLMHQWAKDHGKAIHEHGEKAATAQG